MSMNDEVQEDMEHRVTEVQESDTSIALEHAESVNGPPPMKIGPARTSSTAPKVASGLPLSRSRFAPYTSDEFHLFPEAEFAIDGVLPAQGIACVYGPPQAGKSALVLSMGHSLVTGTAWFGREVKRCRAWYLAQEGAGGLRNRVQAIENHFGQPLPKSAKFVFNDLRLISPEDVGELAKRIEKHGGTDVVIIDTLACAMAGGDENSSRDMGLVVAGAKALQRSTGGLVLLVHHTGKDASRGLRGHSSLLAALDASIEVKRHDEYRSWRLAKSRDSEDGVQGAFVLETVELGLSNKGRPISSIAVIPTDVREEHETPKVPVHKNQIAALARLMQCFEVQQAIEDEDFNGLELDEAVEMVKEVMTAGPRHAKLRAQEAIDGLVNGGFLIESGGVLMPPDHASSD